MKNPKILIIKDGRHAYERRGEKINAASKEVKKQKQKPLVKEYRSSGKLKELFFSEEGVKKKA